MKAPYRLSNWVELSNRLLKLPYAEAYGLSWDSDIIVQDSIMLYLEGLGEVLFRMSGFPRIQFTGSSTMERHSGSPGAAFRS